MINFNGMKSEESKKGFEQLPAGPYIGRIVAAKVDGTAPDQSLVLRLEVAEGDHAGYFTKRYKYDCDNAGQYTPRYKGDFRLRIPNDSNPNARYPETDKRRFNDATWRIEQSNPGYRWDGDETKLGGKMIGFSMQDATFNDVPYTTIGRLEIVDDIRKGLIKVMPARKPRYSQNAAPTSTVAPLPSDGFTPVEDPDVPF